MKGLIPVCLLLAVMALAGCTNPDAPSAPGSTTASASPQNAGEPAAPPPPSPSGAGARCGAADTRRRPSRRLHSSTSNWTYRTLSSDQRTLAAMSVGAARLAEQQAAASSRADTTIARGHICNSGQILSIARDLQSADAWVIVTREQTGGDTQYEGLPAAYHVTLAQLARVPGGYAVGQWLPQS